MNQQPVEGLAIPTRYLIALVGAVLAAVALILQPEFFQRTPYLAAGSASLLVLALAGVGPAVVTQVLTILTTVYLVIEPRGSIAIAAPGDWARLGIFIGFLAVADLVVWRTERIRGEAQARERLMRQAEARYRHVMEEASEGIVLAARDGPMQLANRRFAEMVGYSVEEVLKLRVEDLYDPADLAAAPLAWAELEASAVLLRTRRLRRKDGSLFVAELSARLTADGMAHTIVRDVTERIRKEAAVRAERDMLEGILATSVAGILVVDPAGRASFANRQAEVVFGIDRAGLLGVPGLPPGWELRRPDGSPLGEGDRATRKVLATGEPVQDARFMLRSPQGAPRFLSVNAAPLRDASGAITAVVLSVQDRTEREAVERELRDREEQLKNITAAVPGVVYQYVVSPDGSESYTYVSPRAEELLGATPAAIIADAQLAWRWMDPGDRRAMELAFALAAPGRAPWSFDFRVVRPGRGVRWLRDIATAVEARDPPRTIWSGVIVDVTDQKQMQEQLLQSQKMDSLGRLAGGVAHDFNNLLTVIRGYADVLLGELAEGDPRSGEVGEIKYAADRAAALTRQLLAVSRRQVLVPTEVDLNTLAGEMERMLLRVIGEHIRIVTVPGEELGVVRADPGQLEQVLLNLSVNARDAMPQGGTLTILTRSRVVPADPVEPDLQGVPAGEYVELCVSDTGAGMDEATREKVFEPFFTTKPVGQGTGLGLSTVYGIVQQSHGAITVESAPGKGTRVHVFLPRLPGSGGAAAEPAGRPAARPGSDRRGTVLVVEDDERVRQLTTRVLEQYGYATIEARDGTEALALLDAATRRIDAVVSDVLMPGMHGRELIGRIRLRRPDLPVIFLSGYTGDEVSAEVRGQARQVFLQKPFAPDVLAAALEDLLAEGEAKPPATAG